MHVCIFVRQIAIGSKHQHWSLLEVTEGKSKIWTYPILPLDRLQPNLLHTRYELRKTVEHISMDDGDVHGTLVGREAVLVADLEMLHKGSCAGSSGTCL